MDRRTFIKNSGVATGAAVLGAEFWRTAFVEAAKLGPGPYGALGNADSNGVRLPAGFTSRVIATSGQQVPGTSYTWHFKPDGGFCFPMDDGGWLYVSNSEVESKNGGASSIRFDAAGTVVDAWSILSGTSRNCSGGATPWRTYLSCEETAVPLGRVYECDPYGAGAGVKRPLLGAFNHEAAVVDPGTGEVYLTEDAVPGRFYRFVPKVRGDLSRGQLYAASVTNGNVTWVATSSDEPDRQANTTAFNGGEGAYVGDGAVYFTTKGDKRVWEYTIATKRMVLLHDAISAPASNLNAVDAIIVHRPSGDLYVAEDGGNLEVGVIGRVNGERQVASFLGLVGHNSSEITGLAFSPDGTRLYFGSQRGTDGVTGMIFEVTGPFRTAKATWTIDRDSYVRGGSKAGQNFGTQSTVQVCENADDLFTKIGYMSVNTTGFDPIVQSATLRVNAAMTEGGPGTVVVRATTSDWSETGINWDNRPQLGKEIGRITVTGTTARYYELDVTSHVVRERAAGRDRVSFGLTSAANGPVVLITSHEAGSKRPQLVLTPLVDLPLEAVVVPATADAHVRGGVSASTNFGTSPLLEVRQNADPAATRISFVAIDTQNFVREVSEATLRMQARSTGVVPQTLEVFAVATGWTESGLTWNNQPALGKSLGSVQVKSTSLGLVSLDVTSHVLNERTAGRNVIGFAIKAAAGGPLIEVNSRQASSNPPRLVLS